MMRPSMKILGAKKNEYDLMVKILPFDTNHIMGTTVILRAYYSFHQYIFTLVPNWRNGFLFKQGSSFSLESLGHSETVIQVVNQKILGPLGISLSPSMSITFSMHC